MTATRPVPSPSPWSAPYWEAARGGRLLYQVCRATGKPVMYPKRVSPYTLRDDLEWRQSEGRGEVYTYTVQRAGAPSGFAGELPYVIAVVRLDEGFQIMANIVGPDAESVRCGSRVRVDFQAVDGGDAALPVFRLESA